MSNQEWGVTERGFHRPTYVELLDAIEYKARELFGSKANLTVRSPLGIFLRIFAWMLNILFSLMEDVYNSRFVDTAGPASTTWGKPSACPCFPRKRRPATSSSPAPPVLLSPWASWSAPWPDCSMQSWPPAASTIPGKSRCRSRPLRPGRTTTWPPRQSRKSQTPWTA